MSGHYGDGPAERSSASRRPTRRPNGRTVVRAQQRILDEHARVGEDWRSDNINAIIEAVQHPFETAYALASMLIRPWDLVEAQGRNTTISSVARAWAVKGRTL